MENDFPPVDGDVQAVTIGDDANSAGAVSNVADDTDNGDAEDFVVQGIVQDLKQEKEDALVREDAMVPVTTMPFDPANLSKEQLEALKRMLNATPDRATKEKQTPTIQLRVVDGKYVTKIGQAKFALRFNEELQKEVKTTVIPVWFHGGDKEVLMEYKDFMEAPRAVCKIIKQESNSRRIGTGREVVQRETGKIVEMEYTVVDHKFIVELPTKEHIEVETCAVNA